MSRPDRTFAAAEDNPLVSADRPELFEAPREGGVDATAALARRLAEALIGSPVADAPELEEINERLLGLVEEVEALAGPGPERLTSMWTDARLGRHDPISGSENVLAPPLLIEGQEDGSVLGHVTLGLAYQGPPGHVHGGVSAMLLDHVLGMANHWGAGPAGMTGTLTLRYHAPTPLFTELTFRANQEEFTDRKTRTVGTISNGDTVCVSAEGVFINKFLDHPN